MPAPDLKLNEIANELPKQVKVIAEEIKAQGGRLFLVGGAVRDFLRQQVLGQKQKLGKDIDLEVFHLDLAILETILNKYGTLNFFGKSFGVLSLRVGSHELEFAVPRQEVKTASGHRGFTVTTPDHLDFQTSSLRRDFTVNAMGIDLSDFSLHDYHGGLRDLKNKTLRHVSEAFSEDPLRALRAMQFAARFEFQVASETLTLCAKQNLSELPRERLYNEFVKLLTKAKKPSLGLSYLKEAQLLHFFPELFALVGCPQDPTWHPEGDVWVHTLMVVDEAALIVRKEAKDKDESYWLTIMFAALCHDLGKPLCTETIEGRIRSISHDTLGEEPTRHFLARLTNNIKLTDQVVRLVLEHLKPVQLYQTRDKLKESTIKRLALRVNIEDLILVAKADFFGRYTSEAQSRLFPAGSWLTEKVQELDLKGKAPSPWLVGKDLIALGLTPGPIFKEWIDESFELQLEGHFKSKEDLLKWLEKKKLGLKKDG